MAELSAAEIKDLEYLQRLQSSNQWMSQEQFDRLKSLKEKQFKGVGSPFDSSNTK